MLVIGDVDDKVSPGETESGGPEWFDGRFTFDACDALGLLTVSQVFFDSVSFVVTSRFPKKCMSE